MGGLVLKLFDVVVSYLLPRPYIHENLPTLVISELKQISTYSSESILNFLLINVFQWSALFEKPEGKYW